MMTYRPNRKSTGFTLLEVLVALAVLAISLGAVIKIASLHTDTAHHLEQKTLAHWVGMNRWAELQLIPRRDPVYNTSGVELMAGREWHWTQTLLDTPDRDVKQVRIEVGTGGVDNALVSLSGYRVLGR
jgi:general secretion pathway protein I